MIIKDQTLTLNTGNIMPLVGLGVYKVIDNNELETSISTALNAGYRMIDTASAYKNEEGVGRAIMKSKVPREDLFITTKVWNTAQRMGDIEGAFLRSLDRMQLDYVDLYLIHWPVPGCYLDTWAKFEKILESGRAKAIGVSNFSIQNLNDIFQFSGIVPAVNQIEYHPLFVQDDLVEYCQSRGIAVQAYAPLARGAYFDKEIINRIALKYIKTPAQIGLRWAIQKNISVIPKSTCPERIISNAQLFDFELTQAEVEAIDSLNENYSSITLPEDLR